MIGEKRAGSKVGALGTLAQLTSRLGKDHAVGAKAVVGSEAVWNAQKAAKEAEAARQKFDVEKYRALFRIY